MARIILAIVCVLFAWAFTAAAQSAEAPVKNHLVKPEKAGSWILAVQAGAMADIRQLPDGVVAVTVSKPGTEAWHAQLFQSRLSLQEGARYTVRFEAKSDAPRMYKCSVGIDVSDWHAVSPMFDVPTTKEFKQFEFGFAARGVVAEQCRGPQFDVGLIPGTIYLRNVELVGPVVQVAKAPLPQGFFEFPMYWNDSAADNAMDVSFLNAHPADRRIVARNGHFADEQTGQRVRFMGTNLAGAQAFPEKEDARLIARRLAKAGINLVRLHAMDNSWAIKAGGSVWDGSKRGHVLSEEQLAKLDYLMAQLKERGIYVNMNLKACKTLTPEDGFPESISKIPFDFQKRVDFFDRKMIDLQKEYARGLLTHKNAYTGLAYVDDPVVMVVEANNENSLVGLWDPSLGTRLEELPEPFRSELGGMWSAWLKKKYVSDEKLTAAWSKGATQVGPSILSAEMPWAPEEHGEAKLVVTPARSAAMEGVATGFVADVQKADGTDWHAQNYLRGLTIKEGELYTVSFRAKADAARKIPVMLNKDEEDWGSFGLSAMAELGKQWKEYAYTFKASGTTPEHGRLGFALGGQAGKVWVEDLQLAPGAKLAGLQPGESLSKGNLAVPTMMTPAQKSDWIAFLVDTERAYADEMRTFVKGELRSQSLFTVTQVQYGGITGMAREHDSDYADAHAYWQHPRFPGTPWDPANWTIENSPEVAVLETGELARLAMYRVAGKPYSISEYDHPAPSDYACEMMPTYATFAALQDWDAICTFTIDDYSSDREADRIQSYFDQMGHPAKWCLYPSAALIFRQGLIEPATQSAVLELPSPWWEAFEFTDRAWKSVAGSENVGVFDRKIAVSDQSFPAGTKAAIRTTGPAGQAGLRLEKGSAGNVYLAASPQVAVFVGYIGGQTLQAGQVELKTDAFGNNFGSVMAVACDGKALAESNRILVSVCGRVENQGIGWNQTRTSVATKWGYGPTMAQFVPARLTIPGGAAMNVYALDSTGKRLRQVKATISGGKLVLTARPADATIIYEIVKE